MVLMPLVAIHLKVTWSCVLFQAMVVRGCERVFLC
jgi:hypothetical protein